MSKRVHSVQALILLLLVAVVTGLSLPQQPREGTRKIAVPPYVPPKGYVCYRASQPIRIDGKIDDAAWAAAPWTDDFVDIEGDKRPPPRHRTRVKMLWDDECLYIAAELEEPHVQASFTKHDSYIFHDDNDFEVFLDPDGDNHFYAELEMNALNTTWDLLLTRPYRYGGRAIDAWEIDGLRTAVHVDGTLNDPSDVDRGWTVEIAWPWKGLKRLTSVPAPPEDGDQWRINFSRVQWQFGVVDGKYRKKPASEQPEDNWVWSPQHEIDMHVPERWGYLQFSTAAPGTAMFEPDPAGPARYALYRIHEAQLEYRKLHRRWATTMTALALGAVNDHSLGPARIETTTNFYEASIGMLLPDGKRRTWSINSDALIRRR